MTDSSIDPTSSICLRAVLHQTVSTVYGDLVTRRTGQAVRFGIVEALEELETSKVAIIDFTSVRCLDYSCANEIVGKLLLQYGRARYFIFRGVSAGQEEAIDPILRRYKLAAVAQDHAGNVRILGWVSEPARRAFQLVAQTGGAGVRDLSEELDLPDNTIRAAVDELVEQRLAFTAIASDRLISLV